MMTALPDSSRRGHRRECVVEAVIDLVGDEADALAFRGLDQRAQRIARHHGAGRVGGTCHQHALERRAPVRIEQHVRRDRPARRGRGLDQHRLAAERLEDVPIRRIARHRDRDAVAGLEQREKGEDETGRRSRGRDHARRLDRDAIGLGVVARDARAQRRDAERLGVVEPAVQRRARGVERGRGRRGRRLADFQVDNPPAGGFDARRRRHDVHHHERRNVAARRRHDQPRLAASSIDSTIRYRAGTAPLLPHSAASVVNIIKGTAARYQLAGPGAMGPIPRRMRAANRRVIAIVTTRLTAGGQGPRAWNFGFA